MKRNNFFLKLVSLDNTGKVLQEYKILQQKLIIGRQESADIKLSDELVSDLHAVIILTDDGLKLIDLDSANGSFVNGTRIESIGHCFVGDVLQFGNTILHCLEYEESSTVAIKQEQVKKIKQKQNQDIIPLRPVKGLVVIDGEYCDIIFKETGHKPLTTFPIQNNQNFSSFIDPIHESTNAKDEMIIPISKQAVEICSTSSNCVLSHEFVELRNGTYYANSLYSDARTIHVPTLATNKSIPFFSIDNGEVTIHKLDNHQCDLISSDQHILKNKETAIYNQGTNQIFMRLADAPPLLSKNKFSESDDSDSKATIKSVSILFSLMLLLLLVDTILPIPEAKQIAIIYKKPVISENSKIDDGGTKQEMQDPSKVQKAKRAENQAQAPKQEAQATSQPVAEAKAPIKAYQFNMSNSLNSIMDSKVDAKNIDIKKTVSNNTATTGVSAVAGNTDLRKGVSAEVGSLGSDSDGTYDKSYGARGLYSKDGVETTYVQPKTIVLGSIDPELLRKILQEYLPQFRHCYQQELEINDAVKGVVDLNFQIDANGAAGKINIKTQQSAFTKRGIDCMGKVLQLIQFPKPKGGGVVDVRQPLNFFAEKG